MKTKRACGCSSTKGWNASQRFVSLYLLPYWGSPGTADSLVPINSLNWKCYLTASIASRIYQMWPCKHVLCWLFFPCSAVTESENRLSLLTEAIDEKLRVREELETQIVASSAANAELEQGVYNVFVKFNMFRCFYWILLKIFWWRLLCMLVQR